MGVAQSCKQVSFPVSGHRSILGLGRTLTDGEGFFDLPSMLRYMSTYTSARHAREDFGLQVLEECIAHRIEVCFIDSVALAVSGNPGDFEVIINFFDEAIADVVANGITPVSIDDQRRLAAGERNQSLGPYGSVWKENLSPRAARGIVPPAGQFDRTRLQR